jgi:predicted nuclease of predicted toxin-antitoxin system
MSERLLVDECLTPELVPIAHAFGFEAYHVVHIGLSGEPDRVVFHRAVAEGFLFVTNDREDWNALVSRGDLHAGLLVIRPCCRREVQKALFRTALAHVQAIGGLMSKVLEIDESAGIATFDLPRPVTLRPAGEGVGPQSDNPAVSRDRRPRRQITKTHPVPQSDSTRLKFKQGGGPRRD